MSQKWHTRILYANGIRSLLLYHCTIELADKKYLQPEASTIFANTYDWALLDLCASSGELIVSFFASLYMHKHIFVWYDEYKMKPSRVRTCVTSFNRDILVIGVLGWFVGHSFEWSNKLHEYMVDNPYVQQSIWWNEVCLIIFTHSTYVTYLVSNINIERLVLTSQSTLCHRIIIVPTTEVAIKSSGSKWWSLGKKCALGDRETHRGRAHERLLRMMCCILRWSYMISECTG